MSEERKVAIMTGASRGAGRGGARALGAHGCTVYIRGRSTAEGDAEMPGTIHSTAREVTEVGGQGIAVRCDHADDDQVEMMIARVIAEQGGIDIIVNNACAVSDALSAPHMVKQEKALIVFTSSPGAMHYCFGPAYGSVTGWTWRACWPTRPCANLLIGWPTRTLQR